MCEMLMKLDRLKRPRLLINAARIGAREYRRDTHLTPDLKQNIPLRSPDVLRRLIEIESELDAKRVNAIAGYPVAKHVSVLIAMMGEAHILRTAHHSPNPR